jgi:hypothetical protein
MNEFPKSPEMTGFRLMMEFKHEEIAETLSLLLQNKNPYTRLYKGVMFGGFMVLGGLSGWHISSGSMTIGSVLLHFTAGVAASFLLIPAHELLHGLGFKKAGADKVSYRAIWKKLIFYAIADGFPANYQQFRTVALMPFTVITLVFVLLVSLFPAGWSVFLISVAVSHAAFCIGDFALLGYMFDHKEKDIITVDDLQAGKTFFSVRE